ncbi:hypothetical protein BDP81DRAFT_216699 [Colletotrichum phormii]|uniref:Uncharacterized protein n=1 Tax=Colletotrichum phormii TaxID=359342 RepID=A0AAI9ZRR0_9PEZI|nr:uncharacterized protein BDP81DRAFT_216699 [Colletotrichum phormii]KAK1636976.1 hypothetical protein BDP81DRAFT_216699 [Colletotrichum phormii]
MLGYSENRVEEENVEFLGAVLTIGLGNQNLPRWLSCTHAIHTHRRPRSMPFFFSFFPPNFSGRQACSEKGWMGREPVNQRTSEPASPEPRAQSLIATRYVAAGGVRNTPAEPVSHFVQSRLNETRSRLFLHKDAEFSAAATGLGGYLLTRTPYHNPSRSPASFSPVNTKILPVGLLLSLYKKGEKTKKKNPEQNHNPFKKRIGEKSANLQLHIEKVGGFPTPI